MYQHRSHKHRLICSFSSSHEAEADADKRVRWSMPSGPDRRLNELIRASAERRRDTLHTMQALEKYKPMLPVPCRHSSCQTSADRSVLAEKNKPARRERGDENTHHSAHQTPGSAFLNPRASAPACAPHPPLPLLRSSLTPSRAPTHPPCARNPRPWVRAVHDSSQHPLPQIFSQSIHFRDPFSSSKKGKKTENLPATLWRSAPLTFLNVSTISGWLARHAALAMSAVYDCCSLRMCVCFVLRLCVFEYINVVFFFLSPLESLHTHLDVVLSTQSSRKRALSFLHKLIRGYTQERAAAARTSLIMLMRSPGDAVIEV